MSDKSPTPDKPNPSLCEATEKINEIEDRRLEQAVHLQQGQQIEQDYEKRIQFYESLVNTADHIGRQNNASKNNE